MNTTSISSAVALAMTTAVAGAADLVTLTPAQADAVLANARVVGLRDKPELILDMPLLADAPPGVIGIERVYKGICGPNGAVATIDQLMDHAQSDLQQAVNPGFARTTTEAMGNSPTYNVQYDETNTTLTGSFLPRVRDAAEYIGDSFDNRVNISVTLELATLDPGVLGSAGSRRYRLRWDDYLEGLRNQSLREGTAIANAFPDGTIPANFSTGTANVDEVTVTEAQYRAIFGDTVRNQSFSSPAVSIRYNPAFNWSFVDPCVSLPSNRTSLTDVAAHEFIHPLGFVSEISGPNGGGFTSFADNNANNRLSGLDLARFFVNFNPLFPPLVFPPASAAEFASRTRNGEGNALFPFNQHQYVNPVDGFTTNLESGDDQQPSHLAGGLGLMDPTISQGDTNCPFYLLNADLGPLDDMGWRPIFQNGQQDCNNNGVADTVDIFNGTPDFDEDGIPDSCENFPSGAINAPSAPQGVLRTIYEAPGFTDLFNFIPGNATVVRDELRSVFFSNLNLGTAAPRVVRYRARFFIPAYDDTAFRVARPDDALLLVNNTIILNSDQAGDLTTDSGFVTDRPAAQSFIQLDSGWFDIELYTFHTGSTITGDLIFQNRINGDAWTTIPTANLRATLFEDCNNNGINDDSDPDAIADCQDCNNDGIPDANQGLFETTTDLGQSDIPTSGARLFVSTSNTITDFDTEIAIYDPNGNLVANDDDGGDGTTSILNALVTPGTYTVIVAGFNTDFGTNINDINFPAGCPAGGTYRVQIEDLVRDGTLQSGFVDRFTIELVIPDCDNDGIADEDELDCDNDGIPDDCQKPQLADFTDNDFEIVANENDILTFDTFGSNFDTEMAVYDRNGDFVTFNDDANGTLQSEISRTYAPGEYILVLAGFDTAFFASDFLIVPNAGTPRSCSEGGTMVINVQLPSGFDSDSTEFPSGRLLAFPFAIEPALTGCNPADLAAPFGQLTFADISAFLAAFSTSDPAADLAAPQGQFTFADISAFLGAFSAGCP